MRCYACNVELSDYESTLRGATTGQFLDLCGRCIEAADIEAVSYSMSASSDTVEKEWDED